MDAQCKIYQIVTTPELQTIQVKYKADKYLEVGQAVIYNEKMFIQVNIILVESNSFIATTTASLFNIRIIGTLPQMIKQNLP